MRHQVHCPGREEMAATAEWQCQTQLQPVETENQKAKEMLAYQNALFAAAFCRKENGRCEGCGS